MRIDPVFNIEGRRRAGPSMLIQGIWMRPILNGGRPLCVALLMGTSALAGAIMTAEPAQAQNLQEIAFDIPSQPLGSALAAFSQTSGIDIAYGAALPNVVSPAVAGRLQPREALSRLLAGSGLTYRFVGATNVRLEAVAAAGQGAIQLGAVRVEGASGAGAGSLAGAVRSVGVEDTQGDAYSGPGSSAHLSQDQIQRFRGTTVGDVIAGVPGVHTGENRNSGGLDLNIRGMQGMNRVPVVVDGAHQSTVVYRGYSGVASRNYLDPDLLAEMVIDKGPSTRPEAVGATGGVMVARTIAASDIIQPGETFGMRVRGELRGNTTSPPLAGTKGGLQTDGLPTARIRSCTPNDTAPNFCRTTVVNTEPFPLEALMAAQPPLPGDRPATLEPTDGGGSIVVAKRWGEFDVVAAYAQRSAGNYFAGTRGDADARLATEFSELRLAGGSRVTERLALVGDTRFRAGEQVINTAYDNRSYLVKGTGRWGDGHALELGFNRFDSDYGDIMPSEIVRGEGFRQGVASNVVVDTWTARYRWKPEGSDWINLRANLWKKDLEVQRNLYYGILQWLSEISGVDDPVFLPAALEHSERIGFDIDNTSRFSGGYGTLEVRYGVSLTKEDLSTDDYPELASGEYSLDLTTFKPAGKRDEFSAFVSATWEPTSWLQLDGALRYTESDTFDRVARRDRWRDENNQLVFGDLVYYAARSSDTAPIFAATFKPIEGLEVYARYAEAIRTPSLFENLGGFAGGGDGALAPPTFDIRPERMRSREVGLNYDRRLFGDDLLRLHFAYFDNSVRDYIYRSIGTGATPNAANLEEAIFEGIELQAEYDRGWIYGAIGGILYDDLNYCDYTPETPPSNFVKCYPSGVGFSDTSIPPEKSGSATLGTRWFQERLDVGVRGIYNGRRPDMTFVGSGAVNVRWSPHAVWDFYSRYEINDRLSVDFNIDNVGDKYYADPLLIGITAAPGRTMRLGLTARF